MQIQMVELQLTIYANSCVALALYVTEKGTANSLQTGVIRLIYEYNERLTLMTFEHQESWVRKKFVVTNQE